MTSHPDARQRVVLRPGAEAEVAGLLAELGAQRVLVVCTARHREGADRVASGLGARHVGTFAEAETQVPREVADRAVAAAREARADWVLAHGGGTAIGVAKAVALEVDVRLAAVVTTYSGSEMTDIWGITTDGVKTTGRDPRVQPYLVVYDPELLVGLRPEVARTSLFNALAHSVDALFDASASAHLHDRAERSVRHIVGALVPDMGLDDIARAQRGASLAGGVLAEAQLAVQHKLAHTLGGSFGLPHASVHAALLPHTLAFNLHWSPEGARRLRRALGTDDPAARLFDLAKSLGLPTSLRELDFDPARIDEAVELALKKTYPNPRPLDADSLGELLSFATMGRRPSVHVGHTALAGAAGVHRHTVAATAGAPLHGARVVLVAVHGRGATADALIGRLLPHVPSGVAIVAPQAAERAWYPESFRDARDGEHLASALSMLDAAWALARTHVPAERVAIAGFSQGACLLLSWLHHGQAPGAVAAWSGAPTPGLVPTGDLSNTLAWLGTAADDPWVCLDEVDGAADLLTAAGATLSRHVEPGAEHTITAADEAALTRLLEALMARDARPTLTGFGNELASEAVPGALPRTNTPLRPPLGLYPEQINGTGFTVERALNRRVWLYRLRPQVQRAPFERIDGGRLAGSFDDGVVTPDILRYAPVPLPAEPTTFVEGLTTFAGTGGSPSRSGMAIHLYGATADMEDEVFINRDGELVIVPQQGGLTVRTEVGWLEVAPGAIAVIPRGMAFAVSLPDGASRGWVSELFEGHYVLPERGLVGANGLANARHFHAPVADFEDRRVETRVVVRHGGGLWQTTMPTSPFDVVAWHGNYLPFAFDLLDFVAYWSVTVDHVDPSILTVLTAPHDTHGRSVCDLAVFRGRYDVTQDTFRPPFLHRNAAIEFNAVVKSPSTTGPYRAGAFTYTPYLSHHGVSASRYARLGAMSDEEANRPHRLPDSELWVQWESAYQLRIMPWMLDHPERDDTYLDQFSGYPEGELLTKSSNPR